MLPVHQLRVFNKFDRNMIQRIIRRSVQALKISPLIRRLRTSFNYTKRYRLNGKTFQVPNIYGMTHSPSELWMLEALRRLLVLHTGAFLDVGVNLGQTLLKIRSLEPQRPYVGLEPNPMCFFYTRELIRENLLKNCSILPVGLFIEDKVLTLSLFQNDPVDSSASLIGDFRPNIASSMLVPVMQWETLKEATGSTVFGIVKIDVEGAELEVIKTLRPMLRRDRPLMLLEILPVYSYENNVRLTRQCELETLLTAEGYRLFRIEKTPRDQFSGFTPLGRIEVHADLTACDYVAAPEELAATLFSSAAFSISRESSLASRS
jgi:FkbM family methyltransferase